MTKPKGLEELRKEKMKAFEKVFGSELELLKQINAKTVPTRESLEYRDRVIRAYEEYRDFFSSLIDEVARETIEAIKERPLDHAEYCSIHNPLSMGECDCGASWQNSIVSDQQEKINSYLKK